MELIREQKRYKNEIREMEERWTTDGWTDEEEYLFRKYGFDDLIYDELLKKHHRNMNRIRQKMRQKLGGSQQKPTLWDYIRSEITRKK